MKKIILIIFAFWLLQVDLIAQSPYSIEELVSMHAPKIRFSTKERFFMSSTETFLKNSKLIKKLNPCEPINPQFTLSNVVCTRELVNPAFSNDIIGHSGEEHRLTRNNDGIKFGDPDGALAYVNVLPAFYQKKPHFTDDIEIQYYYFFPWNGNQEQLLRNLPCGAFNLFGPVGWLACAATKEGAIKKILKKLFTHEGDWEVIKVIADKNGNLKKVYASAHQVFNVYTRNNLSFEGTHPILYSAAESHAFYNDKGYNQLGLYDHCDDGLAFDTWSHLEIVEINDNIKTNNNFKGSDPFWLKYAGLWGDDGGGPAGKKQDTELWSGKETIPLLRYPFFGNDFDYNKDNLPFSLISGPPVFCSSAYVDFEINTLSDVEVDWVVTPENLVNIIEDEGGNKLQLKGVNHNSQGWISIEATVLTKYDGYKIEDKVTRKVWLGTPGFQTSNHNIEGPRTIVKNTFGDFDAPKIDGIESFDWIVPSWWSVSYDSKSAAQISVGNSNPGHYPISFEFSNRCNLGSLKRKVNASVEVIDVGSGNGPSWHYVNGIDNQGDEDSTSVLKTEVIQEKKAKSNEKTSLTTDLNFFNKTLIYPNPANNQITVLIRETGNNKPSNIQILNVNGQIVLDRSVASSKTTLDVSSFDNGFYMVRINNGEETIIKKLIIEN